MNSPLRHRHTSFAPQQRSRNSAPSVGRRASRVFWRGSAIVLVGVALLGAAAAVREFAINIQDRRVVGGVSTIRVQRGETVLLRWRTDEPVLVHVHGYDIEANLTPDSPNVVRFVAAVAGRFPITAHQFGVASDKNGHSEKHREVTLLYLEVLPE